MNIKKKKKKITMSSSAFRSIVYKNGMLMKEECSLTAKELCMRHPGASYTTTRTCGRTKALLNWALHKQRLSTGLSSLLNNNLSSNKNTNKNKNSDEMCSILENRMLSTLKGGLQTFRTNF